jgi:hypothetical protein
MDVGRAMIIVVSIMARFSPMSLPRVPLEELRAAAHAAHGDPGFWRLNPNPKIILCEPQRKQHWRKDFLIFSPYP